MRVYSVFSVFSALSVTAVLTSSAACLTISSRFTSTVPLSVRTVTAACTGCCPVCFAGSTLCPCGLSARSVTFALRSISSSSAACFTLFLTGCGAAVTLSRAVNSALSCCTGVSVGFLTSGRDISPFSAAFARTLSFSASAVIAVSSVEVMLRVNSCGCAAGSSREYSFPCGKTRPDGSFCPCRWLLCCCGCAAVSPREYSFPCGKTRPDGSFCPCRWLLCCCGCSCGCAAATVCCSAVSVRTKMSVFCEFAPDPAAVSGLLPGCCEAFAASSAACAITGCSDTTVTAAAWGTDAPINTASGCLTSAAKAAISLSSAAALSITTAVFADIAATTFSVLSVGFSGLFTGLFTLSVLSCAFSGASAFTGNAAAIRSERASPSCAMNSSVWSACPFSRSTAVSPSGISCVPSLVPNDPSSCANFSDCSASSSSSRMGIAASDIMKSLRI